MKKKMLLSVKIQPILTEGRSVIEQETETIIQEILN